MPPDNISKYSFPSLPRLLRVLKKGTGKCIVTMGVSAKGFVSDCLDTKVNIVGEVSIGTATRGAGKGDAQEQNQQVRWKGSVLTFPSHVQKVPVSSIVFPGMTASIFSTLSCGVRSPSIGKSASVFVISLYLRYESAI